MFLASHSQQAPSVPDLDKEKQQRSFSCTQAPRAAGERNTSIQQSVCCIIQRERERENKRENETHTATFPSYSSTSRSNMDTRSAPVVIVCALAFLCVSASSLDVSCLAGGKHKDSPSLEPQLHECQLYSDSACCSVEVNDELAISPVSRVNDIYWNRCGNLSTKCEDYMKRVECFYRCSPEAARWPHPERPTAIQGVPLCTQFCNEWYEACEEDLTCARNWISDWQWGPQGNNCSRDCVTYKQMYKDGKDLCENIWGDSFLAVEGQCPCLTLSESDIGVTWTLTEEGDSSEERDSTKENIIAAPGPCQGTTSPLVKRIKNSIRKRSVFMEDVEGSGSGF